MAYQKTIWSPGDTISSAKLNNIEEGIAGLETEIAEAEAGLVSFAESQSLNAAQKMLARNNIGAESQGVAVKYNEAQELSPVQQAQARSNIGLGNLDEMVGGRVRYDAEQNLTDEEKEQAQANIGLDNISELVEGVVRYDGAQTLTDGEKATVLSNIGLDDIGSMVSGTVKYDEVQTLQDPEKAQARVNIGAAASADLATLSGDLAVVAAAVSDVGNVVADVSKSNSGIAVTYLDGSSRSIEIDSGGTDFDGGYVDENNLLHITLDGEDIEGFTPFALPAGGGGGGSTAGTVTITRVTDAAVSCVHGDSVSIQFTFAATDSGGDTVGDGVGVWYIGGVAVARNITIAQGSNSFDIGPYLTAGTNNVKLTVSVDTGGAAPQTASKTWTVNAINMYFTWPYNDSQVNVAAFADRWVPYGDIEKTTHTSVDNVELSTSSTTRSGVQQTMTIPMQTHGVHGVRRWLTATINGTNYSTPVQYHEMIFAVDGVSTPIVAVSMLDQNIKQYDTIQIPYVVYNPASITASVTLTVDGVQVGSMSNVDRTTHTWTYTPTTAGVHTLAITCGGTSRTLTVTTTAVSIDTEEVSGYSFRFKASEMASNDAVENWTSGNVDATFSGNFDWINGGLKTETDSSGVPQQYLCIKSGTRMTINHPLFAVDPKVNGMSFKMIFKVSNCRDYEAQVGHCYSDVGIRLYAHEAVFNSSGTSISVPYGEDEYIELEFDVYPAPVQENDGNFRYMMAWMDGVITTCRVYGASDNFVQPVLTQEGIVLGSDDCDLYLYMIKAYPTLISRDNHIDNFIMDAPNAAEMVRRYNRNDILDSQGEIDYEKLMDNNPDLRVWLYEIPYLTNGKKDKVSGCEFHQFWPNGDRYYELTGTGKMSVQGTSSVKYIRGAANTDIEFTTLYDGNGNNLLAGGVKDEDYGNNIFTEDEENPGHAKVYTADEVAAVTVGTPGPEWVVVGRNSSGEATQYIRAQGMKINDDSCPITYSNTKVNFASCEQVNNMCNAAWYQRFNPYPSLTARDCMEFAMGVQFIKDSGSVPDDAHFVLWGDDKYHMYSIANMGNSKKNVHVFHDLSNPTEVCIEVNDNNADQMRMISDDLSEEDWSGDVYYGMRYPDTKNPSQAIRNAWQRLVSWMANSNPNAATGDALATPETYGNYTFRGHSRPGTQVLRGTTVTQYAGTYTHDTFARRMAKMLSECEDYMVMDSFIYHFVYLERHTMVDNVSKNNFWSSTDLIHWDLSKAYDMDTSDGNNNQGQMVFDYGNEYNDDIGGMKVFNGADSVWFVFCANLYEACRTMFTNREAEGAWSASAYHSFLLSEQQKVPERCWVQCYWYDYLRTYEQGISEEWMTFLDGGQKTHQRKHFEFFEELYDASKYRGTASTSQDINFRAYTPNTWINFVSNENGATMRSTPVGNASVVSRIPYESTVTVSEVTNNNWRKVTYDDQTGYVLRSDLTGVEPTSALTVTMYNKMYLSMDAGTTALAPVKVERGVPYTIDFSNLGLLNNTMIVVYTASMIQGISGMEKLYPDTCVFSAASRLRSLTIGAADEGYQNPFLRTLALGNNKMLEYLFVQNLPNAASVLDLSNCPALLYVDATGSGFTGYNFADGGLLTTAILNTPVSLSMMNLANLTDEGLTIADKTGLTTLRFENIPGVDSLTLVNAAMALQILRLTGINWTLALPDALDRLYNMQGMDESGYTIAKAVVGGSAYIAVVTQRLLDRYAAAWPNLTVTYGSLTEQYAVTFVNADGTAIKDLYGNDYVQYVDRGSEAYDPVLAGEVIAPTLAQTAQYTYTFSGWDGLTGAVLANKTVTAAYTATTRSYTVRWFSQPGTMLKQVTAEYGDEVVYDEDPHVFPTLSDEESNYVYKVFTGWDKSTGYITGNTDVYAVWDRAPLPTPGEVELEDMSVAQIWGVARNNAAATYWTAKDHTDIQLGKDFTFSNVESAVLVQNRYFDGQDANVLQTEFSLLDADAPTFTMAIDYEFNTTTSDATLVSCFTSNGSEGFRLRYNSRPEIQWGDRSMYVGRGAYRGIVVLRHIKGSNRLDVVSDNPGSSGQYQLELTIGTLSRTSITATDAVLTFGGIPYGSSTYSNKAAGWIHWCKIWYADLGMTVIQQLAGSPHHTLRMEYIDAGRYRLGGNSLDYCAASFIANHALQLKYRMNETTSNVGGWDASEMRTLMNTRIFDLLPYEWQQIIQTVQVRASAGNRSNEILTSEDKLYLPAELEISSGRNRSPYNQEITALIPWYTTQGEGAKYSDLIKPDGLTVYDTQTDPTGSSVYNVQEGDIWYTSGRYYIYVPADVAAKHTMLGVRTDHTNAEDGGKWVRPTVSYLRSPLGGYNVNFMSIYESGGTADVSSNDWHGIVPCFSI